MLNVNLLDFYNEKNKEFTKKLINDNKECLGIYSKTLKEIAKLNKNNLNYILEEKIYHDEYMICTYLFSYIKHYEKMLFYLNSFIDSVTNWAICDSLVSNLTIINKNKDQFLEVLESFNVDKEFYLRFIFVILKTYYVEDKYFNTLINYLDNINSSYYYVQMSKAWLICEMLIKEYSRSINYLKNKSLELYLKRFLIRKVKDTFRLTSTQKEEILSILGE